MFFDYDQPPFSGAGVAANAAEAVAGTDATKYISPATLRAAAAALVNNCASRQGLWFNGTAGEATVTLPALRLRWTVHATIKLDSMPASLAPITGDSAGTVLVPVIYVSPAGALVLAGNAGTLATTGDGLIVAGKAYDITVTHDTANARFYINGLVVASPAETTDLTAVINRIGRDGSFYFPGTITGLAIYNRTLSAAEVLALYEAGTPAQTDYNAASNTSLLSGNDSTFTAAGSWTVNGGSTISGGKLNLVNGGGCGNTLVPLVIGRPYRFTITIDSVTAGNVEYWNGSAYVSFASAAGTYTVDFVAAATYASGLTFRSSGGNAVLDTALAYNLGLLCSPEAAAPGNGYQWKDMSGNKADLTLSTTGLAWTLADRRPNSVRGTLTWAGTHEGKSLIGQRALPAGAVVTLLTSQATTGSSGSGKTVGTTNTATRWVALATYTTAKKVETLANQLPSAAADADNDVVVDPDTANFTGSIETEVFYCLSQ